MGVSAVLKALWMVGVWLVKVAVKVLLWTLVHPVSAIFVGSVLLAGGDWLEGQHWAGAQYLGALLGRGGSLMLAAGFGSMALHSLGTAVFGEVKFAFLKDTVHWQIQKWLGGRGAFGQAIFAGPLVAFGPPL